MLKIAIAQMKVIPGHPSENTETMLSMMAEAKEQGADLVVFPEMAVPGYLLGDAWEQTAFIRECEACGEDIIKASQDIAVIFGNVAPDWSKKNNDGRVRKYNALFAAYKGKLLQPLNMPYPFVVKTLMPNYREFDDSRHFFSLEKLALELGTRAEDLLSLIQLPIGDRTYSIGGLLCEDGWGDDYNIAPVEILARQKPDVLVNISSSPYTLGKNGKRHRVFGRQAKEAGVPLFYVNNVGIQNNGKTVYTFDGSSTLYNAQGIMVDCLPKYVQQVSCYDLDAIADMPKFSRTKQEQAGHIFDALVYGVGEFLKGIGMKKVVIGISGGIDSAVAAALYTHILGPENILLVNMPSVFNSATTKGMAKALADNLGCNYAVMPIQESVDHTIDQLENTSVTFLQEGTQFNLQVSSFVAENIQARDRSARVLAGAAAAFGGGFTCNANKAETTVGYSTLYGDQSGFLCALADLWKYQVYDLARYMNKEIYGREAVPQASIDVVPSAELSSAQNVDEGLGDPIKYPYHDYLFRSFVEHWQKATPEDILRWYKDGVLEDKIGCAPGLVQQYFPTIQEFIADLERWWRQFSGMAIAKRIQAPPIVAVSRRAYGFDHREAQNGVYYTRAYKRLKAELLGEE